MRCVRSMLSMAFFKRGSVRRKTTSCSEAELLCPLPITPQEFAARRSRVAELMPKHSLLILPSHSLVRFSHDVFWPFRQQTDLLYLTGCRDPGTVLVMRKGSTDSDMDFELFVKVLTKKREMWNGKKVGIKEATEEFGADRAFDVDELADRLGKLTADCKHIFFEPDVNPKISDIVEPFSSRSADTLLSSRRMIHQLRVIKSEKEVELMKFACQQGAQAFQTLRKELNILKRKHKPLKESHIAAHIEYLLKLSGAQAIAYPSIVAYHNNATVIHYTDNNQTVDGNKLLLVDAGGEFNGYCSDITRTFSIGPKKTDAEQQLYDIVLTVQKRCIARCVPDGKTSLHDIHMFALRIFADELIREKIIPGDLSAIEDIITSPLFRRISPHYVGHYLGMDVHDTHTVPTTTPLRSGMVVTIEPGLYFPSDLHEVPEQYRGIGIRIEDDVLISEDEPIVLTLDADK
eukprot:GILK01009316.1.p1 GENE.GILK01009316.1~~GILK01009316.1.p1  ORF type:complete len:460 (-),score=52.87 GILK01009316.1:296-1675(-)